MTCSNPGRRRAGRPHFAGPLSGFRHSAQTVLVCNADVSLSQIKCFQVLWWYALPFPIWIMYGMCLCVVFRLAETAAET